MSKHFALTSLRSSSKLALAAILAFSALLPLVLNDTAHGAQLTSRYVDLSSVTSSGGNSSEGSGRDGGDAFGQDVTYTVGFTVPSAHANLEGIVIDFCNDSPITNTTCTAPTGFNVNEGSIALANGTNITLGGWTVDANTDTNTLILTNATGENISASTAIEFDLGTTAAADGITNPTVTGTFYARILTYTSDTFATSYTSTAAGTFIDDGGVAMAIANHLTLTARVQEVLQFCVGTDDSSTLSSSGAGATGDDCTDVLGTDLSLGVVDSSSIQRTSDADNGATATNLTGNDGLFMVRTNASSGAIVYYKAEHVTGLSNGGAATLRRGSVDDCGTIASVSNACFNSAGGDTVTPAQSAITAGTELFGMTLRSKSNVTGGATNVLTCDAAYDGDGSCSTGAATGYAWSAGATPTFDTIATSSGPIDDEIARIEFAATASPTTPTGLYTTTANFVATSTY